MTSDVVLNPIPKRSRGIPGRVFVLVFVPLLVVVGSLFFAVGARFQTIMNRLEVVRSLWPNASHELISRYDRLATALDERKSTDQEKEQIKSLRAKFNLSSQFDRQSISALAMEKEIAALTDPSQWNNSDFDGPALSKLIAADQQRKKVQNGMIGWLTIQGLRLKLPPIFEPMTIKL